MAVFTYKLFFLFLEAILLLGSKNVIHGIMEVVVGGRRQTPDRWTIYFGVVSILGFYNNSETWYVGILLIYGSTEVNNEILHLQELSKKNVDIPVLLLIWTRTLFFPYASISFLMCDFTISLFPFSFLHILKFKTGPTTQFWVVWGG